MIIFICVYESKFKNLISDLLIYIIFYILLVEFNELENQLH